MKPFRYLVIGIAFSWVFFPWVWMAVFYAYILQAKDLLGHWPKPYVDDITPNEFLYPFSACSCCPH